MSQPATQAVSLVVPLYDEAGRFPEFGKLLVDFVVARPGGGEVVFVDDGSSDRTAELVQELLDRRPDVRGRLLQRPHEGKGAAVAAGIAVAAEHVVAFCDLDLSTPLPDLERIIAAASRAPVLAIGSRDLATSSVARPEAPVREALGRAYNRLVQAALTPGVVDTQCGAKAAQRSVWQQLLPFCRQQGFAWDAEAVGVALALGVGVQQVPVTWRHDDRSKVNLWRDGARMVQAVPRMWTSARRATSDRTAPVALDESDEILARLLAESDTTHWWYRSKAALIATALKRTEAVPASGDHGLVVDIGAGSGGVTQQLGWLPDRVVILEHNPQLGAVALRRFGLAAAASEAGRLPVGSARAAFACFFDVLEHLQEPQEALAEAHRILRSDGHLLVTVPAHPRLWSQADVDLGHFRRYTRRTLAAEITAAGFRPVLLTHVFSWLVPPAAAARARSAEARLEMGGASLAVDRAALTLTAVERRLLGRVTLPFGTSILCVAARDS